MFKQTQDIMGMPITVEIRDSGVSQEIFEKVFTCFRSIDKRFSTYKPDSEISRINRGEIPADKFSPQMREVFKLSQQTKWQTQGFFDILTPRGIYDPSGLVKGWAIYKAAEILKAQGLQKFFIEAGGDVQSFLSNPKDKPWSLGIRNPFNRAEIVKVLSIKNEGVATSGTYTRGQHIYNPHAPRAALKEIVSLTVVGPNIYEADRFATAAFAMASQGLNFIEYLPGFEAYQIDRRGIATMTSGFNQYVSPERQRAFSRQRDIL